MRPNRRQATGLSVSLFPFLAVLICTMGMLIVMLVLAVKSSSVKAQQAKQEHTDEVQKQHDELADQLDLEQFRVEQISKMRPDLQDRLEKEKLRRSHLDDEIRKLIRESRLLSGQFLQIQEDNALAEAVDESQNMADLEQHIEERKVQLQELRNQVAGRPTMYSIVPTKSANGLPRRPIYIECTPTGMVLQPSGIRINLNQFTRPISTGNPLDAALLATREYWNRYEAGSSEGEPYPLIVVRPGGATAYAIARRAMASWDDEFGYELVEASKVLNWGEPDTNLVDTVNQAIQISMQRQELNVVAGRSMWIDDGGRSRINADGNGFASGGQAGGMGGTGGTGTGNGTSDRFADRSSFAAANRTTGAGSGVVGEGTAGGLNGNTEGRTFDTSKNDSLSRFAEDSDRRRNDRLGAGQHAGDESAQGSERNPLRRNGLNETGQTMNGQQSQGGMSGDPSALANSGSSGTSGSSSGVQPLSDQRGDNWALPTRTPGATPYRRPIRVECHNDHYVVYPGNVERKEVRVEIDSTVDVAIDELVNQVWNQIEGWGMAEIGGYWKPVLRIATPNQKGEVRADELARKLESSGIEIERLERIWR